MNSIYKKGLNKKTEEGRISSEIEAVAIKLIKDILLEATESIDDWDCIGYVFELLSNINTLLNQHDRILNLIIIEEYYRNDKNIYNLHEKIQELIQ